jgi:hypothetical protein
LINFDYNKHQPVSLWVVGIGINLEHNRKEAVMATTMGTKIRRTLAAVMAALLITFVVPSTTIAYLDLGTGVAIAGEKGQKNGHDGDGSGVGDGEGGGHHGEGDSGEHRGQAKHA